MDNFTAWDMKTSNTITLGRQLSAAGETRRLSHSGWGEGTIKFKNKPILNGSAKAGRCPQAGASAGLAAGLRRKVGVQDISSRSQGSWVRFSPILSYHALNLRMNQFIEC